MNIVPIDIINLIFDLLDLKSQINFHSINKFCNSNLFIRDLYNINKYSYILTNKILSQRKFESVNKLYLYADKKVSDISFMKNLTKLNIGGNCGVDQKGIEGLNLVEL